MNPVDPEQPVGPRVSWWVPATNARNSWRVPAVGPHLSWPDPAGGPTVGWHVPTSLAARSWQVPAVGQPGRWRGTRDPADLPGRTAAGPGSATTQPTWCAPTGHKPTTSADTRAKLVAPVRTRGCVAHNLDDLADRLRAERFQELARVLERKLAPEAPTEPEPPAAEPEPELPVAEPEPELSALRDLPDVRPDTPASEGPAMAPSPPPSTSPVAPPEAFVPVAPEPAPADLAGTVEPAAFLPEPEPAPRPAPEARLPRRRKGLRRRLAPGVGVVRGTEHGNRESFLAEARRQVEQLGEVGGDAPEPAVPEPEYVDLDPADLRRTFRRAVEAAGGVYHHVVGDLPDSLLDLLVAELDAWEIVVSGDEEVRELAARLANRGVEVAPATPDRAVAAGMGVTSAMAGIAATGSLVLDSRRDKGRLAALLPPVHLCVLPVERLVATPSDVLRNLGDRPGPLSSSLMLVTGPSHRSDVERLLTVGARGPSALHVVVLERPTDM